MAQRRAEISIRLALGAGARAVMWLAMKHGMSLAVYGVCLGALGAWGMTRLLSTLLYKVSATDPWVFGSISALLLGVAMLASYLPAWRASKLIPWQHCDLSSGGRDQTLNAEFVVAFWA